MKYIDAEKLKERVTELIASTRQKDWPIAEYYLKKVIDIIDSLQQEPVDLEKAAEEYADKHGFRVPYDGSDKYYNDVDVKASLEGFKAGAKWMAEQMKGGGIPKNIEL